MCLFVTQRLLLCSSLSCQLLRQVRERAEQDFRAHLQVQAIANFLKTRGVLGFFCDTFWHCRNETHRVVTISLEILKVFDIKALGIAFIENTGIDLEIL